MGMFIRMLMRMLLRMLMRALVGYVTVTLFRNGGRSYISIYGQCNGECDDDKHPEIDGLTIDP